ncbi:LOW QUALITY PROTEIN: 3-oxoacyl-[acyl-carrier-protein] reductase FabG-like [Aphomia sociella]
MSFAGKIILVTGASSGIGAATAIQFAKEGADVAIVGRNEDKLKKVVEKFKEIGKTPLVITADVSIDADARRIIKETIDKFQKLDVLVNNAGLGRYGTILDGKVLESYDAIMDTNVRAVIQLTTLSAPHLVKSKGNIVNVSSVAGVSVLNDPVLMAYCISKAAVNHFTLGAALELAPSGVRVNAVSPGPVRTVLENSGSIFEWDYLGDLTALGRVSEPDEIANVVLFLASDKAIGVTGSNYVVDNGRLLGRAQ